MRNEYQDQDVWWELYSLHPEARHVFRRQTYVGDFDTRDEAEAYAQKHVSSNPDAYRIKRTAGLA